MPRSLDFEYILTPDGLESHRRLMLGDDGKILAIESAPENCSDGWLAIPGMPNAHSHAFQRAMVGHGEAASGEDSFWSWRTYMYSLACLLDPDDLYTIACQAYTDMLRAGFTSVGEFHYLHHLPDGARGDAMGRAVIEAARDVGLRMVFLPVYYQRGGFGKSAEAAQSRFVHNSVAEFSEYLAQFSDQHCGIAPHSLRAVAAEDLAQLMNACEPVVGKQFPVHIHISEQRSEVDECIAHYGTSPISLLHDTVGLSLRWNLVHATHADERERRLMIKHGANPVLCPLTEAYLGDGIFPAAEFAAQGGKFSIGSDSNVRIDAIEELRLLEYGQRLSAQRRARLADASGIGMPLWRTCATAGAQALGLAAGTIAPGQYADIVVLDRRSSPIAGVAAERVMDAWLTGGSRENIASVYVGGERKVAAGQTAGNYETSRRFVECLQSLRSRMAGIGG